MRTVNFRLLFNITFLLSLITMSVCSVLAWMALQDYGATIESISERFTNYNGLSIRICLISYVVLTILSVLIYRRHGKGHYFLLTTFLMVVFSLIGYVFLQSSYFEFLMDNDEMLSGSVYLAMAMGFFLSLGAVMVSLFTYIIARWQVLRKKQAVK